MEEDVTMRGLEPAANMTITSWGVVGLAILVLAGLVCAARWAEKRQADDLFDSLPPLPMNPEAGVVTRTPGTGLGSTTTKDAA
jgi:hypothetical protein